MYFFRLHGFRFSHTGQIYDAFKNFLGEQIRYKIIAFEGYAKSSKIILQLSAGKCEVSFSKKQVRYGSKIVLERFFKECESLLTNSVVVLKFSGPVRMRRFVLNLAFYQLRLLEVSKLFFDIKANKCFNGCRPPKKRRKKNKGARLLK